MRYSEGNMRAGNDQDRYVKQRLEEWAKWFGRKNANVLGYPGCSMEYHLMTSGIVTKSTAPKAIPTHEAAEEIEALINEMHQQNKMMALALRIHYVKARKSRDRSEELKISATRFRVYVSMAQQWLAGRLSAGRG
jgi:hypothetical protein